MKKSIVIFCEKILAYDKKSQKMRIIHPIGFLLFIFLAPILFLMSPFVSESIVDRIKSNFKLF